MKQGARSTYLLRLPEQLKEDLAVYCQQAGISQNAAITLFVQRGLHASLSENLAALVAASNLLAATAEHEAV